MTSRNTINRTIQLLLTGFGVWPGIPFSLLYSVCWSISLVTNLYFHYQYFIIHLDINKLFDLMDCLSSFLAESKFFFKLIVFSIKQREFIEIITTIKEDWSYCDDSSVELRETSRKAKLSSRISNGLIILHTIAALTYVVSILLADVDITDRTTELPLMMKMEFPFVIDTLLKYRLILVSQFLSVMAGTLAAAAFNALFLILTLHVGGQINILLCWLTDVESIQMVKMTKILQKHRKIINFSEKVENLYSSIVLLTFISNTVMICSLAFLVVTSIGTPDGTKQIMRSLLFYTITNLEAFIFCFAGEYLSNKSIDVGHAAYNCGWYVMKTTDIRVLLLIILRSQRKLKFTVGKMMDLSLECYTNIMKASGSYLSVLLAMK